MCWLPLVHPRLVLAALLLSQVPARFLVREKFRVYDLLRVTVQPKLRRLSSLSVMTEARSRRLSRAAQVTLARPAAALAATSRYLGWT